MIIEIKKTLLRQKARELAGRAQELTALNNKLEALIGDISGSWDGNASAAWVNSVRAYEEKAVAMVEVLEEFQGYANQAADQFEEEDTEAASIVRMAF